MRMQIFKVDHWTPREKHNSDGCWSHENIILSLKCLNGSPAACTKPECIGKILTLQSMTGRFVPMEVFLSLRTLSFKNFSVTFSEVIKLIFYDLNLVSWVNCFLLAVLFSIALHAYIKTKKILSMY